jgi:hypothetical protein
MLRKDDKPAPSLRSVWEKQRQYNFTVRREVIGNDWLSTYVLGLISECDELLAEAQWKAHRSPTVRAATMFDTHNVALELSDVTKYIFTLWDWFGFTEEDMLQYVDLKTDMVERRFRMERSKPEPGQLVIVTDLDGSIANFVAGLAHYLGIDIKDMPDAKFQTASMDIHLDMDYIKYNQQKKEFEAGGGYANLPPYEDGVQFIQDAIHDHDAYLAVVTARPRSIKGVWYDTVEWLDKHQLSPNKLIFGESERVLYLAETLRTNPVILIDDDPIMISRAKNLCPVIVRPHSYNAGIAGRTVWKTNNFTSLNLEELLKAAPSWT